MTPFALLRMPEPASADLRAELAKLDLPSKAQAVADLRAQHRRLFLDEAPRDDLGKVEAALTAAERDSYCAGILDEELRAKLAEAEQREAIDALIAEQERVEAEAAAVAEDFAQRYADRVADLLAMVDRLDAAEAAASAINARLRAAGFDDQVAAVEPRTPVTPPLKWLRTYAHAVQHGSA